MREITFRGKRLDNGEWVMSKNIIRFNEDNQVFIAKKDDKNISIFDLHGNILQIEEGTFYKVDAATVGQFTGVTDVNGRKIFEGDIVKFTLDDEIEEETVIDYASVKYNSEHLRFYLDWVEFFETPLIPEDGKELEVVGNIYDNPELLGGVDNG